VTPFSIVANGMDTTPKISNKKPKPSDFRCIC
jgi:hypothetical protein